MYKELIERLRHPKNSDDWYDLTCKAADAIEKLQAENERLKDMVMCWQEKAHDFDTENARLRNFYELTCNYLPICDGCVGKNAEWERTELCEYETPGESLCIKSALAFANRYHSMKEELEQLRKELKNAE